METAKNEERKIKRFSAIFANSQTEKRDKRKIQHISFLFQNVYESVRLNNRNYNEKKEKK